MVLNPQYWEELPLVYALRYAKAGWPRELRRSRALPDTSPLR